MKCWPIAAITILSFTTVLLAAQPAQDNSQLFSSDLVAWTSMQQSTSPEHGQSRQQPTPDPTPQSEPAPRPEKNPNSQTPSVPQSSPTADSNRGAAVQTFTGTIAKDASGFILKVSENSSYKLTNGSLVQQYLGQHVQVTGKLDPALDLIYVQTVEPVS